MAVDGVALVADAALSSSAVAPRAPVVSVPAVIRLLVVGDRQFVDEFLVTDYEGKVMKVAKSYAWVRPCGCLQPVFLNRAKRDIEGEPMVYVALADVAQVGLVLTVGTLVLFRPYICPKGVGGCEVESA